jgi:hypothetical protein
MTDLSAPSTPLRPSQTQNAWFLAHFAELSEVEAEVEAEVAFVAVPV